MENPGHLDEAALERLRRGIPLRITASGRMLHAEDPVEHPGVARLFREGLDLSDTGEPILRVGEMWCYLKVEDCVLRVHRVQPGPGEVPWLHLDDGRGLALDPTTLWEEADRGLRCTVPSRRSGRPLSARFTNTAQIDLMPWISWEAEDPILTLGERRFNLGRKKAD